jgi:hypothetical protein
MKIIIIITCALLFGGCVSEPMMGTTVAECAKLPCKAEGWCTPTQYGCQAGSHADCRQSAACRNEGRCDMDDGACVAQTPIP